MLELDASTTFLGSESHLHLGLDIPTGRAPREGDDGRRLIRGHAPDVILSAVGSRFVKSATYATFNEQLGLFATEATRPPLAYFFAEDSE